MSQRDLEPMAEQSARSDEELDVVRVLAAANRVRARARTLRRASGTAAWIAAGSGFVGAAVMLWAEGGSILAVSTLLPSILLLAVVTRRLIAARRNGSLSAECRGTLGSGV